MSKAENKAESLNILKNFAYLLWDGLNFFGHDDNKLDRLKGKDPKWYDRFLNARWVLFRILLVAVLVVVFMGQYDLLGTIKSQELTTKPLMNYTESVHEALPLTYLIRVESK